MGTSLKRKSPRYCVSFRLIDSYEPGIFNWQAKNCQSLMNPYKSGHLMGIERLGSKVKGITQV